jgi:hypothetical protein
MMLVDDLRHATVRALAEFLVVGICTLAFAFMFLGICRVVLGSDAAGSGDFAEYWASGQRLAHRADPYDGDAILALERSVGFPAGVAILIMWNPLSALLLVLPLGFLGPRAAELLWSLLLLASLVSSVRMVWPSKESVVAARLFIWPRACLFTGQASIHLCAARPGSLPEPPSVSPLLAGVSLWLCTLKPHLFLPFGLVLLTWAISRRSYKVLIGTALGASTGIALILDPHVLMHYEQMATAARVTEAIPCLSIRLRWIVSPDTLWLQYLPAGLGCIWALIYFRRHRDAWDWMEHGSLLMLVSILLAPYTWLMDQAIPIPALLHAAYFTRSRRLIAVLALPAQSSRSQLFEASPSALCILSVECTNMAFLVSLCEHTECGEEGSRLSGSCSRSARKRMVTVNEGLSSRHGRQPLQAVYVTYLVASHCKQMVTMPGSPDACKLLVSKKKAAQQCGNSLAL